MRRITSTELLDDDRGTPQEIGRSLDDLWRINQRLGGVSSCMYLLERFFSRTGTHPVRILDVGCGDARLAAHLRGELLRRNLHADFVVLDRRITHVAGASRRAGPGLLPVVADIFAHPFADGSFEVVMCNLFLHHFSGEAARELLRKLHALAGEAVLVNDLERHLLPYLFIRCAIPFARSRITRHDGPASVRQAYTRDELVALARGAGFRDFEAERLRPFRLGLTLWKKN